MLMGESLEWFRMDQDGVITPMTEEEHRADMERYPRSPFAGHPDYRNSQAGRAEADE